MTYFTKDDAGKLRFDLITPEFLEGLAHNLTIGAAKYADRNWEVGADWHRYIRSTMSHWNKWIGGEEYDAEGFHHLDACAFGIMVLRTYLARGIGNDDRPTSVKRRAAALAADQTAAARSPSDWRAAIAALTATRPAVAARTAAEIKASCNGGLTSTEIASTAIDKYLKATQAEYDREGFVKYRGATGLGLQVPKMGGK